MTSRRDFLKQSAAAGAAGGMVGGLSGCRGKKRAARTIILGIDGMDPRLLGKFIATGMMPHAAAFAKRFGLHRLGTTNPAQSPVAWSSFISGTNPGGHGIFDFITRAEGAVLPELSTSGLYGETRTLSVGGLRLPLRSAKMP